MLASYSLLKKFVDLEGITPEQVADKLTFAGLEVEGIEYLAQASKLVIGQIKSVENHPDSDHLHVLIVDEGEKYGDVQIVCGAPNVRVGLKVIVALPGCNLPALKTTIVASKVRGVESNGMCCSLVELGVDKLFLKDEQINGIEELSEYAPVGEENVLEYLSLNDTILDINVLANRSDVLAIISLAKEVASLFDRKLTLPEFKKFDEVETNIKVSSSTPDCKQFSIKVVKDVVTKESPDWLKKFLMAQGIRPISNIVDIGNYVMILTGQPLHMYDLDKLPSNEFVVKKDVVGDILALDNKEYHVDGQDILVTNGGEAVCIAGVMGCANVTIDENTKNIAIEAANFKGATIRRTTVKTGLSSDSSAHFIKGINPYQDEFVLNLTAQLLVDLADAKIVEKTARYNEIGENKTQIECSKTYINKRLGTNFDYELIKDILTKLYIKIVDIDQDNFLAFPPDHRIDITCDADLSEEIIRFVGFDAIQSQLPMMVTTTGGYTKAQKDRNKIRDFLLNNGINEALTYTLISPKENEKFVLLTADEAYEIMNPMTVEHSVCRRSGVNSLLNAVKYNLDHQQKDIALFEITDICTKNNSFQELVIALNGTRSIRGKMNKIDYDFYDAHGLLEGILALLGVEKNRYKEERLLDSKFYHPGRTTKLTLNGDKEAFALVGEVHPLEAKDLGTTYIVNVNLTKLYNTKVSATKMATISKYPTVKRDLSLVVKEDVLASEIVKVIKSSSKIIKDVEIFDIYKGEFLQKGTKSVAITILYSDPNKTLVDQDIQNAEKLVMENLEKKVHAELRK